jgi:subtilase family serine protease
MRKLSGPAGKLALVFAVFLVAALSSWTQVSSIRPLITQPVDESKLTVLRGNTHPLARAEFDRGVAPDNLPMDRMLLVLKRSPQQEAALETLMAQQLDKSSPNYHKWLTPQQFGQMFGPSDQDIQKITAWLESHGFTIDSVSNGRTTIEFSGDAAQVQSAFHTPIHSYVVNGEQHWANANDPAIPAALTPAVAGVRSLHNFFPKPQSHIRVPLRRSASAAQGKVRPALSFSSNGGCSLVQALDALLTEECNILGPGDFAVIYNTQPLLAQIDGSGETIAIVSDSNINQNDVNGPQGFRSLFNLPAENLTVTVNGTNPGVLKNGDEGEAILDVEWSGAVATGANIDLVVSESTNSTFGGDTSAAFIVNEATPPPILSDSYGACEQGLTGSYTVNGKNFTSANAFYNSTWQQAAAEGITVVVASGDNGSSACDTGSVPAKDGLQVNGIASTPYNVAVGGTDFGLDDINNPSNYWNAIGNPTTQVSAKSYIPETAWNDTCTNSIFVSLGETDTETACNDPALNQEALTFTQGSASVEQPIGSGGGASAIYAKPCWQANTVSGTCTKQTGITTPNDNARDLPDISLFSGTGLIAASAYYLCQSDQLTQPCDVSSNFLVAGGTSVATQAFAGIVALIDEQMGAKQGAINQELYTLAAANTCVSAANPSPTCVFYDVTSGTNAMPCAKGSPNCVLSAQIVGPLLRPGKPAPWVPALAATFLCALCLTIVLAAFPGRPRRWATALALLVVLAFLFGGAACGGGNGGSSIPSPSNFTIGVMSGYNAGAGYNLATGLGSVNAQQLVKDWQ